MKGFTIFVAGILVGLLVTGAIAALWLSVNVIDRAPESAAPGADVADATLGLTDDYLSRQINRRLEGIATATLSSAPGGLTNIDLRVAAKVGALDLSAGIQTLAQVTAEGGRITVRPVQLELGGLRLDPERLPAAVADAITSASSALEQQLNAEVDDRSFAVSGVQTDKTGITLLLRAIE